MSCLNFNISKANLSPILSILRIGGLQVDVKSIGGLQVDVEKISRSPTINITRATKGLTVRCSVVCTINGTEIILRFNQDTLSWLDSENKEGTIKYNTLIATSNWSLEELIIEELL